MESYLGRFWVRLKTVCFLLCDVRAQTFVNIEPRSAQGAQNCLWASCGDRLDSAEAPWAAPFIKEKLSSWRASMACKVDKKGMKAKYRRH